MPPEGDLPPEHVAPEPEAGRDGGTPRSRRRVYRGWRGGNSAPGGLSAGGERGDGERDRRPRGDGGRERDAPRRRRRRGRPEVGVRPWREPSAGTLRRLAERARRLLNTSTRPGSACATPCTVAAVGSPSTRTTPSARASPPRAAPAPERAEVAARARVRDEREQERRAPRRTTRAAARRARAASPRHVDGGPCSGGRRRRGTGRRRASRQRGRARRSTRG